VSDPLRISVVIPCRDDRENLLKAIAALLQCDPGPSEIIIVDDGSITPLSLDILDPHIRILRFDQSRGPAFARNEGARAAREPVLLFLDSDVVVERNLIDRLRLNYAQYPEATAVQGTYSYDIDDPGLSSRYQNIYYVFAFATLDPIRSAVCATFCFSILRTVFLDLEGFDTRIPVPTVEDEAFGYLLASKGYTIRFDADLRVRHLARYSLPRLLRRKFRMSYHQIRHFLGGGGRVLAQLTRDGHNRTHHGTGTLIAIALAPLLLFLPVLPSFPAIALPVLYGIVNLRFWRFCSADRPIARLPGYILLTWLDHLAIVTGLLCGMLHHVTSFRQHGPD